MTSKIVVIAVGIAAIGLCIMSSMTIYSLREGNPTRRAPFVTHNSERLRERIKNAAEAQQKRLQQTFEKLSLELKSVSETGFAEARNGIEPAVTTLTSIRTLWAIIYMKAKGGDPDSLISPILERYIVTPCIAADASLQARLQAFSETLHAELLAFQSRISGDASAHGLDAIVDMQALKTFEGSINTAQALTQKIAESGLYTGLGVVLETVFIRQTCAALVRIIAPIATRLAGTAVVSGVVSQLDSPLPGPMDLAAGGIAAAGLVWTAYDIYAVSRILPEQLGAMLTDAVSEYQKDSLNAALKQASDIQRKYSEALAVLVKEVAK